MSLINCKMCGNKISTSAQACPKCGHPVKKKIAVSPKVIAIAVISIILITVVVVWGIVSNKDNSTKKPIDENTKDVIAETKAPIKEPEIKDKEETLELQKPIVLFENDKYTLSYEGLGPRGVDIILENKTDVSIQLLSDSLALDGQTIIGGRFSKETVEAQSSLDCIWEVKLDHLEHQTISGGIMVSASGNYVYEQICFSDIVIGQKQNQEYDLTGTLLYEDDICKVLYTDASDTHIFFLVENKLDETLNIINNVMTINDKVFNQKGYGYRIAPKSYGKYWYPLNGTNIEKVNEFYGVMRTWTWNEKFPDFEVQYPTKEANNEEPVLSVRAAYETAINLTVTDLHKDPYGRYKYKDLIITGNEIDKESEVETVNSGSIYRKVALLTSGFYSREERGYDNWDPTLSPILFGFEKKSTYLEMKEYVDNISLLIDREKPLISILTRLSSLESVDGNFDFNNSQFHFTIDDLTLVAEELGISEEMLGYVLAYLEEYKPEVQFDENTYTFSITNPTERSEAEVTPEPHNSSLISKSEFEQLKTGMTYEEVVAIIGGEGTVLSESGTEGDAYHTIMYYWDGSGSIGANANAMFQGGKLMSKAQIGLQ